MFQRIMFFFNNNKFVLTNPCTNVIREVPTHTQIGYIAMADFICMFPMSYVIPCIFIIQNVGNVAELVKISGRRFVRYVTGQINVTRLHTPRRSRSSLHTRNTLWKNFHADECGTQRKFITPLTFWPSSKMLQSRYQTICSTELLLAMVWQRNKTC